MKKEALEHKTFEELREMASKKGIEGRSAMSKDELVEARATNGASGDTPNNTTHTKSETTPEKSGVTPGGAAMSGQMEIKGAELTGKNPTRLFQTGPHEKTWLSKDQAQNWETEILGPDGKTRKVKTPFYWAHLLPCNSAQCIIIEVNPSYTLKPPAIASVF